MTAFSAPVGRPTVWQDFQDRLAARKPAVIVIAGEPGSGRSHMLRAFASAAAEAGYAVTGPGETLSLEPTTRVGDVSRALAASLGRSLAENETNDAVQRLLPRAVRAGAEKLRSEREIFTTLRSAAPVYLGVDGYAPSGGLQTWIGARLLPRIRRMTEPVVLVFADRPEQLTGLRQLADVAHVFGDLDRGEVEEDLRRSAARLRPPLSATELDAYTAAAAADPSLLTALNAVLRAACERS